jgi:anti-sigma regulatory factor (Ser/Thr protein kinase)
MKYAYPDSSNGEVQIDASIDNDWLNFIITDSGQPFDPTSSADVDTSLSAEERNIGGLGIHLMRKMMDSIHYERIDGRNVLTMGKKIVKG